MMSGPLQASNHRPSLKMVAQNVLSQREDSRIILCKMRGQNCAGRHASELEKWSLLYDTDSARYGIMTTNMSMVYNSVLKGV